MNSRYYGLSLMKTLTQGPYSVLWLKWPAHDPLIVLVIPLLPLPKLLAIQEHAQNLEEQL